MQQTNDLSVQIIAAYNDLLGRVPSSQEVAFWLMIVGQGTSLDAIRADVAQSPEAHAAISSLYQAELGRSPELAGLAGWDGQLVNGATLAQVRAAIAQSAEEQSRVNEIYLSLLNRSAEPSGLSGWVGQISSGLSLAQVQTEIGQSQEARDDINSFYEADLGRAAEPGGLAYWDSLLASGTPLAQIRAAIAESNEAQADIDGLYHAELGRGADAGGLTYWDDLLASGGTLAQLRAYIAQSPEAQALIAQIAGPDTSPATLAALTTELAAGASLTDLANQTGPRPPPLVAESPILRVQAESTNQGSPVSLSIAVSQAEADLSTANLAVTVTGLAGAMLNHGTRNADGSYTLRVNDLPSLVLTPPATLTGILALSVSATDTEPTSGTSATSDIQSLNLTIYPVAMAPTLAVASASGTEGLPVELTIVASQATADLLDADLSVTVSGLQGATLNHGALNADGSYTLQASDLAGLELTPSAGFTGTVALSVIATDTEAASQTISSSAVQILDVSISSLTSSAPVTPVFNLAPSDQTGTPAQPAATASFVTLTGTTTPGDTVTLVSTAATTVANTNGAFEFDNVSLAQGANVLTVSASNAAGQTTTFSLTVNQTSASPVSNPVLEWNQTTLNAIALDADAATVASRSLAMESLAVYDSVSAINGTPGYLIDVGAPADASVQAAVDEAAGRVLDYLYPAQSAQFDAELATDLAAITDGRAKTDGIALGKAVAQDIIALRANDGSGTTVTDDGSTAVGQWRPTGPMFLPATTPQYADVTPFALTSPGQFLPPPPPAEDSAAYAAAVNETDSLGAADSASRTADETQIAKFWNDQTGTDTPPGAWNSIATSVAASDGDSMSQDAQLLAELNVAEADAGIAAWNTKYTYNAWRPITAIQNANQIGNAAITQDATWQPLLTTPAFPEYTAGHAVFSAAAAQVLDSVFGSDVGFTATSESLPGVTRSFTSFDQAAEEAGMSRVYGGIHFSFSVDAGETLGGQVGDWAVQAFDRTADTTPPKVVLNQTSGLITNQDPTITGDATDNLSGVASVMVSVDGGAATPLAFDSAGDFSVPVILALDGTADGTHTLNLVATDAAGNVAAPVSFTFILATKMPVITLDTASVQTGGSLGAGDDLEGTVAVETGDTVAALSYAFDGGQANPVAFDTTTGAFSQALNLSTLAAGSHTLILTATDAAGNSATDTLDVTFPALTPLTITSLSPMDAVTDVGVTYRPKVEFSRAVDPATLTSNSFGSVASRGMR